MNVAVCVACFACRVNWRHENNRVLTLFAGIQSYSGPVLDQMVEACVPEDFSAGRYTHVEAISGKQDTAIQLLCKNFVAETTGVRFQTFLDLR